MSAGWFTFTGFVLLAVVWLAAIWNRPSHRILDCDDGCGCGQPHRREAILSDTLFAMSGLWLLVGWRSTTPEEK